MLPKQFVQIFDNFIKICCLQKDRISLIPVKYQLLLLYVILGVKKVFFLPMNMFKKILKVKFLQFVSKFV